jgi:hypothetical protein
MSGDREYVLGTDDEELARFGLQHLVWRSDFVWQWPSSFLRSGVRRLADLGHLDSPDAGTVLSEFDHPYLLCFS